MSFGQKFAKEFFFVNLSWVFEMHLFSDIVDFIILKAWKSEIFLGFTNEISNLTFLKNTFISLSHNLLNF